MSCNDSSELRNSTEVKSTVMLNAAQALIGLYCPSGLDNRRCSSRYATNAHHAQLTTAMATAARAFTTLPKSRMQTVKQAAFCHCKPPNRMVTSAINSQKKIDSTQPAVRTRPRRMKKPTPSSQLRTMP